MDLTRLFIFWVFHQFIIGTVSFTNNKIELIKNLCIRENKPTVFYSYVCWNREIKKNFIKSLSGLRNVQGILMEIVDTNKLFYPIPPHRALFIVDLQCPKTENFLQEADRLNLFISPYRWIIFSDEIPFYNDTNIDPESMNVLNSLGIYLDSNVIFVQNLINNPNIQFELFQPYKIGESMPEIIIENYGLWTNNNTFFDKRNSPIISRRRKNLHKVTLRVPMVTKDNKSLAELDTYKTPNVNTIPKADYILTQVIYEYFNCTGTYIFTDTFGGPAYHSTPPKGIFKLVLERKADLGSSFLVLSNRLSVKYIFPSSEIQAKIIFRRPRLSYVENLFTLTFTTSTWIAIAILTSLIIILLAITTFIEEKYKVYNQISTYPSISYLQSKLSDITLVMVAIVTQQGTETEPRSNGGKLILFMLLISLTFLYNAYTALIVVILQSSSDSIHSIIDIANSKLAFGAADLYFTQYLHNITIPEKLYLYNRKIKNKPENEIFIPIHEGVQHLRTESYAFLTLTSLTYHLVEKYFFEHEKCDINEVNFINSTHGWLVTYHNSSYIEHFKVAYLTLYERGLSTRIWRRFYSRKPYCANQQNYFTSAGIEDLNFAFKLFIVGVALSIFAFVVEHIRHRKKDKIFPFTN